MIAAVALAHFVFILFVAFGGFLVLRWPRVAWLHLPALTWGVLLEAFSWRCPLTRIENALRGAAGYHEGFIEHYLFRVIYPTRFTRTMEIVIAVLVVAMNAAIYYRASGRVSSRA